MKTSSAVYKNAQSLLQDTGILNILSPLGTVYLVGSFAANLMWDPDIDILVVTDTPQESALKAVVNLAQSAKFQKLEYGDFKNHPKENRPPSFLVNAQKEWQGENWEIETWFVTEPGDRLDTVAKLNRLDQESRKAIIEKKKERSLSGIDKHRLSSWKIYRDYLESE